MSSSVPGYDTHFPYTWALQENDEEESNPSEPTTPTRNHEVTLESPISLVQSATSANFESPPSPSPAAPAVESLPSNKYLPHFPSSWVLPPQPSEQQFNSAPDLHASLAAGRNIHLDQRSRTALSSKQQHNFVPSIHTSLNLGRRQYLDGRSNTAFDLGPQIALWKDLERAKSFCVPDRDEDRLERFRDELNKRLSRVPTLDKDVGQSSRLDGGLVLPLGQPKQRESPLTPKAQSRMEGNRSQLEGEMAEDNNSLYTASADYGDAWHLPPPVATAYSSRSASSIVPQSLHG
jgi:hypothetical protein